MNEENPEQGAEDLIEGEVSEDEFDEFGQGLDSTEAEREELDKIRMEQDLSAPGPGGIYSLFAKVMDTDKVERVSNLNDEEMGKIPFSVRGSLWCEELGRTCGHLGYANFFARIAKVVESTALSRDGFLVSTFVTSKRQSLIEQKEIAKMEEEKKKKKWLGSMDMFSKDKKK